MSRPATHYFDGRYLTVAQLAEHPEAIRRRLNAKTIAQRLRDGWTVERAMRTRPMSPSARGRAAKAKAFLPVY